MNTSVHVKQIFIYTHIPSISFIYSWKMGHGTIESCGHDLQMQIIQCSDANFEMSHT